MNWFVHSLKNYANFSGRANRREWWIFWFLYCLPPVLLFAAVGLLPKSASGEPLPLVEFGLIVGAIFAIVWGIALLIPLFAVTIRRFHDIGLSGWWWLLTLVPILGGIFHLVCTLIKGTPENNAYGEPPLYWTDRKHRDLARQVSSDLELERKSEEFLNQLSGCMGKNARPESLSPEEKDMVVGFYMRWYPAERSTKKAKEWCAHKDLAAKFGVIAVVAFIATSALRELIEKGVGKPLSEFPQWLAFPLVILPAAACLALIFCIIEGVKCWLSSQDFIRSIWMNAAKSDLLKSYSADIQARGAHDFFAKKVFPAVKSALSGKRATSDPNVKKAVLQCVEDVANRNSGLEKGAARGGSSCLAWFAVMVLAALATLVFAYSKISGPIIPLDQFLAARKATNADKSATTTTSSETTVAVDDSDMIFVQGGSFPEARLKVIYGTENTEKAVASFKIGKHEVTWAQWNEVRDWAVNNGYDLFGVGNGSGPNHPVRDVSLYDSLKWCNAKSEKMGLQPVYEISGEIYRSGQGLLPHAVSGANGYRLPTEKEWEWAASGGITTLIPFIYSGSDNIDLVAWHFGNSSGSVSDLYEGRGTWPTGQKTPNTLGVHDMSGNVSEWCYDKRSSGFFPTRGGSFQHFPAGCSITDRAAASASTRSHRNIGFRVVRSP